MPANYKLDAKLVAEAIKAGNHRTPKAAVTAALREYVRSHKRRALLKLAGNVDYYEDYDHKALRRKRVS